MNKRCFLKVTFVWLLFVFINISGCSGIKQSKVSPGLGEHTGLPDKNKYISKTRYRRPSIIISNEDPDVNKYALNHKEKELSVYNYKHDRKSRHIPAEGPRDIDTQSHYKVDLVNNILFIGDSHAVGVFGKNIVEGLRYTYLNSIVNGFASCGSSPSWWVNNKKTRCGFWESIQDSNSYKAKSAQTPSIQRLLDIYKPDILIVEQGTNLIPMGSKARRAEVESFVSIIKPYAMKVFWLGPPASNKFSSRQLAETLDDINYVCSLNDITVVDSRKYTDYPRSAKDGIHFNGLDGEYQLNRWARGIISEVAQASLRNLYAY